MRRLHGFETTNLVSDEANKCGESSHRTQRLGTRLLSLDSGQATIEFAVGIFTLLMLIFAVFEFSMLMYTYNTVADGAREGLRYAIVHGTDSSNCSGPSTGCGDAGGSNIVGTVQKYAVLSFHNVNALVVTPTWPDGTSTPGSRVKVLVTYNYVPFVDVPGIISPQMRLVSEGRVVF